MHAHTEVHVGLPDCVRVKDEFDPARVVGHRCRIRVVTLSCVYVCVRVQAIGNCASALKIDPKNPKALYRRAFASFQHKDYDTVRFAVGWAFHPPL